MDNGKYYKSITSEIKALEERVKNFVPKHKLSDGEWKESIIRSTLRRHLPKTIGIGTGFFVTDRDASTQVDILLYDTTKPTLFQDGDFVIVTPDCVHGLIEVKTTARKKDFFDEFNKLADNIRMIPTGHGYRFFGIFYYNAQKSLSKGLSNKTTHDEILLALNKASKGSSRRTINCVSIGKNFFCRFWPETPYEDRQQNTGIRQTDIWRTYKLDGQAPAYFIHNVIERLSGNSVLEHIGVWFPPGGKERSKVSELKLSVPIG